MLSRRKARMWPYFAILFVLALWADSHPSWKRAVFGPNPANDVKPISYLVNPDTSALERASIQVEGAIIQGQCEAKYAGLPDGIEKCDVKGYRKWASDLQNASDGLSQTDRNCVYQHYRNVSQCGIFLEDNARFLARAISMAISAKG